VLPLRPGKASVRMRRSRRVVVVHSDALVATHPGTCSSANEVARRSANPTVPASVKRVSCAAARAAGGRRRPRAGGITGNLPMPGEFSQGVLSGGPRGCHVAKPGGTPNLPARRGRSVRRRAALSCLLWRACASRWTQHPCPTTGHAALVSILAVSADRFHCDVQSSPSASPTRRPCEVAPLTWRLRSSRPRPTGTWSRMGRRCP
jgi:hypothetical protein